MGNFERNGSPETSIWKTNTDNFQGYVRAKLEDLEKTQGYQWKEHRATKERLNSIEKKSQYQLGGIGMLYAIVLIVIALYSAGLIHIGGI